LKVSLSKVSYQSTVKGSHSTRRLSGRHTVKESEINDFQSTGILAKSVSGLENEPLLLENLKLKAGNPQAIGIHFSGDTK